MVGVFTQDVRPVDYGSLGFMSIRKIKKNTQVNTTLLGGSFLASFACTLQYRCRIRSGSRLDADGRLPRDKTYCCCIGSY